MGNVGQARDFLAAHCGLPRWKVAHCTAVVEDPSWDLAAISTCCDGVGDAERMLAGALAAVLLKNTVHCALALTVAFAGLALLPPLFQS